MIAAAAVPALKTGIGSGLYLPKGDYGTRIGVSMSVGTHKRVDITAVSALAAIQQRKHQQATQWEKESLTHNEYVEWCDRLLLFQFDEGCRSKNGHFVGGQLRHAYLAPSFVDVEKILLECLAKGLQQGLAHLGGATHQEDGLGS